MNTPFKKRLIAMRIPLTRVSIKTRVNYSYLSKISNGYESPSYETAVAIANVLQTTPDMLFPEKFSLTLIGKEVKNGGIKSKN